MSFRDMPFGPLANPGAGASQPPALLAGEVTRATHHGDHGAMAFRSVTWSVAAGG